MSDLAETARTAVPRLVLIGGSGGDAAAAVAASEAAAVRRPNLRARLVALDVVVSTFIWLGVLVGFRRTAIAWAVPRMLPFALFMGGLNFILNSSQRLYRSQVCAVRSVELNRLFRVAVLTAVVGSAWHKFFGGTISPAQATVAGGFAFLGLAGTRSMFTGWLKMSRAEGQFARPVCVIGTNDEAEDLVHLLQDHPELGFKVSAVVGDPDEWAHRVPGVPVLVGGDDPAQAVIEAGATGVLVAASALSAGGRDRLIGRLMAAGVHVHLSAGLARLGRHRVRVTPLAHQLAFYVEPPQLSSGQAMLKRAIDVAVSASVLVVASPVMLVSALIIKLQDRGPILYRQERVGLGGKTFHLFKLRSMVPDAAQRLAELAALNERQGPLFKLTRDPRVTPFGRFLRTSSIDELPQLINVLRGEMSLVGPRPALPSEFAQFDPDLAQRAKVRPGITGLWQVEARDNPSFRAYRRLDLLYVDNWSVGFDLVIMVATAKMLMARTAGAVCSVFSGLFPGRVLEQPPTAAEAS